MREEAAESLSSVKWVHSLGICWGEFVSDVKQEMLKIWKQNWEKKCFRKEKENFLLINQIYLKGFTLKA